MKPDWKLKTVLVTGASSGIGAAAARRLAKEGVSVWLAARRVERLNEIAGEIRQNGGRAEVVPVDLGLEADRTALVECLRSAGQTPDILINNAGLGWYGYYRDMPWQTVQELLRVNVEATVHLTRMMLPGMLQRGSGHIINVGSIAGKLPNQGIAVYSATKSFVDAFTTSLYRELKGSGVYVSVVRPGPVSTEFFAEAAQRPAGRPIPAERFAIPPEKVADCIWSVIRRPRRNAYVPAYLRLAALVEPAFGWLIDLLGPLLLGHSSGSS